MDDLAENVDMNLFLRVFLAASFITQNFSLHAQKIDSLFFNLYTDSLKKATYNYINVDGKSSDGHWLPLTAKQMKFTATDGRFEGNSLFIDKEFKGEKVTVTAVMIEDPSISKSITIYIKKKEDNEKLKTAEEIKKEIEQGAKRKRNDN